MKRGDGGRHLISLPLFSEIKMAACHPVILPLPRHCAVCLTNARFQNWVQKVNFVVLKGVHSFDGIAVVVEKMVVNRQRLPSHRPAFLPPAASSHLKVGPETIKSK